MKLHLEPITLNNRQDIEKLSVHPYQQGYIESTIECLLEASQCQTWRTVAIYDNEILIGFAMYGYFVEEYSKGQVWLDRLLIDYKYQGKGYGKKAILLLLELLYKEYQQDTIYLSVYGDNKAAISLYEQIGFHFNGEHDTKGEKIMTYVRQS